MSAVLVEAKKDPLYAGLERVYTPKDDDGETLPREGNIVQKRFGEELVTVATPMARMLDLIATKESANQNAQGVVSLDDGFELPPLPVSVLLTLEKQLDNYAKVVKTLPGVDRQYEWTWDQNENVYRTTPVDKVRTKKVPRNHVKQAPTDKHPAQVEMYLEDTTVGSWRETKLSGGVTEKDRRDLLGNIARLSAAVKVAREQANLTEAPDVKIGQQVFEYLGWL